MKRFLPLLLAASLSGCYGSPTEPNEPRAKAETCPKAYQDEYGRCILLPPLPPCTYLDPNGQPFPGCLPINPPGTDRR